MATYTIYHNARCSKSRCALQLLQENGIEPQVVNYLQEAPSIEELEKLVMKLGIPAVELVRKNEPLFKEKYKGLKLNEHEWIREMHENPQLIERPIVVKGHKAVIGRPVENVKELIDRP
ncbi:MAG: arsenate reductase (glutaredoxin) [Flavobacteriales bacterium]|nr:arsenate reductase (glutaredoxin) [Flavobacteriales bacterium]MBP9081031.1 arsenate reductase (glutaredoxin) [Flavobacteriales bacterium]